MQQSWSAGVSRRQKPRDETENKQNIELPNWKQKWIASRPLSLDTPKQDLFPAPPATVSTDLCLEDLDLQHNLGPPGSVRSKSAFTATQAIDELYKVKGQLATEKRRGDRLEAEMEEMMQGLEAKQPEIEEMQAEHSRLQEEVVEMSKFVDQAERRGIAQRRMRERRRQRRRQPRQRAISFDNNSEISVPRSRCCYATWMLENAAWMH